MTAALQSNMAAPTPDLSGVEFATSVDGLPVARIDDLVLAMVTAPSGFAFLASAVFVCRRLAELTRADFIGHDGGVDGETEFRVRVAETAEHKRDLAKLNRVQTRMSASTPWGGSQMAVIYAARPVMAAFTSLPTAMKKSIRCYGRTLPGTKRTANGRSSRSASRSCSSDMSDPWPKRPFAIPGRRPGN